MKINIEIGTEKMTGEHSEYRPFVKANVDISLDELDMLGKNNKELFESISQLMRFAVQHME